MKRKPRVYHYIITLQVSVHGRTVTGTIDGVWGTPTGARVSRFDVFHDIKMSKCEDMAKHINETFSSWPTVTAEDLKKDSIVLFFSLEPETTL